ncbi:MAG: hypothetical protein IJT36_08455 [Alphaproteobacteria bacterium]|nr:hypothetical protein [Alphaproteobacteria bacterium]
MVQHISNNRTNKQITYGDIARITYASCLNFFNNNNMFDPHPLGIYYVIDYHWIKRTNNDEYQHQNVWAGSVKAGSAATTPKGMYYGGGSIITRNTSYIQKLHPSLVCDKNGDERVLIKCCYRKTANFDKKRLGFFLLQPREETFITGSKHLFVYYIVITPKPGLFPVK